MGELTGLQPERVHRLRCRSERAEGACGLLARIVPALSARPGSVAVRGARRVEQSPMGVFRPYPHGADHARLTSRSGPSRAVHPVDGTSARPARKENIMKGFVDDIEELTENNGVDPVLWTPLKSFYGVSDAAFSKRLSAGVPATDGGVGSIRTNA